MAKVIKKVSTRKKSTKVKESKSSFEDLKDTGVKAALLGAAFEVKESYSQLKRGEINKGEFAKRVAGSSIKNGTVATIKGGSANVVKAGMKKGAEKVGKETLKKIANSNAATQVAFGVVDQVWDTMKFVAGEIDKEEYKKNTKKNMASTGGAVVGAEIGAVIGSIVPIIGTGIGAFIGGFIGSTLGGEIVED